MALAGMAWAQMPGMPASHVQAEKVTSGKDRVERKSIAHTEAVKTVHIAAAVEGFLHEVKFKEGSLVQAGDVLMQIDPIRYQAAVQQAEAAVAQLDAKIIYASNRYDRLKRLAAEMATSTEDVETALSTLEELKAKKAGAQATLVKARKDLEDSTIRAEISGRIGRLHFSQGNYITVGEKLATIHQVNPIYVRFPLSQNDVKSIFNGENNISKVAKVRIITANGRPYPETGKVAIVDNRLTGTTDSYTLWAEFKNDNHVLTHKGISALFISLADTETVSMVPLTAVQYDADGAFVLTVEEDGTVNRRDVIAGPIQGRMQSIYQGLNVGETVIVDGAHKTRIGAKVVPVFTEQAPEQAAPAAAAPEQAPISVATDTATEIQDPTVLICEGAHTEAINTVELRPLVQGLLAAPQFKEGDTVQKGDILFTIDSTRYQAIVDVRKSEIAQLEVRIKDAKAKLERQKFLLERNATSKDEVESAQATVDELLAAKSAAEAQLIIAEDDVSRCTIRAGMDARIGRVNFSEGNYITDKKQPLATLVQMSPIYVRFPLSENRILSTFGNVARLVNEAEITLITATGTELEEKGHVSFCDNEIQSATDTQNIWAFFDNKNGELSPGGIVTIKVRRKADIPVPSVKSEAILVDTRGRYVFVYEDGVARRRNIICGGSTDDGRTAVLEGLKAGEKVILNNLATMEDGIAVQPE